MGELQIDEITDSNFENFESALYMKSVSMPLIWDTMQGCMHEHILNA